MKDKKTYIIAVGTIFFFLIFVLTLAHAVWYSSGGEVPSDKERDKVVTLAASPLGDPTHLIIPALSIDAKIQKVGITRNGKMATPNNFTDVGWYKYGPAPGALGSAVIAGHVDDGLAWPAVFADLDKLKEGDDVYVQMDSGSVHYKVTDFSVYDYDADASAVFEENRAHYLRLITCTGTWLPAYRTHNERLVVTAVEV